MERPTDSWYRWHGQDLILELLVQPRAAGTGLGSVVDSRRKLRLTAPALDGRANAQLLAVLAEAFGVPRRQVVLEHGRSGRRKRVRVRGPRHLPAELAIGPGPSAVARP